MKRVVVKALGLFFILLILLMFGIPNPYAASKSRVECRVETDRAVLLADKAQKVVVKISLIAPEAPATSERPSVNLALVLDRSGSMTGDKIRKAREAALEAVRRLAARDIFSLVVYDHKVQTVVPAQSARYTERIQALIKGIKPGGNTALYAGVTQGAAELRKNLRNRPIHRIILLSDGIANEGPSTPDDLGRLGTALLRENISVSTVGVGLDYNEDLMTRLSQKSDGNTWFVESSRDLPRIFAKELGDVLSIVAQSVTITIQCPSGVRPLGIIGREGRIRGRRVELSLNQLYGGQEKHVLLEVQVPKKGSGKTMEVARAEVSWNKPGTSGTEKSRGRAVVKFSRDAKKVKDSVNVAVTKDYLYNMSAMAREKAVSLADKGKREEAFKELKKSAAQLTTFGKTYNISEAQSEADSLEEEAAGIRDRGMSRKARKAMTTKAYQIKNQQKK